MQSEDYPFDPEVPVEETSGYLGHVFDDHDISLGPELDLLSEFDWKEYEMMASELDKLDRCLTMDIEGAVLSVSAKACFINEFIDGLPSVEAIYDCPPDQGPAGGSGYVFIENDGYQSDIPLIKQVSALREALEKDYEILRLEFVNDPDIQKYYKNSGLELPVRRKDVG
jgi:hypothetical protein